MSHPLFPQCEYPLLPSPPLSLPHLPYLPRFILPTPHNPLPFSLPSPLWRGAYYLSTSFGRVKKLTLDRHVEKTALPYFATLHTLWSYQKNPTCLPLFLYKTSHFHCSSENPKNTYLSHLVSQLCPLHPRLPSVPFLTPSNTCHPSIINSYTPPPPSNSDQEEGPCRSLGGLFFARGRQEILVIEGAKGPLDSAFLFCFVLFLATERTLLGEGVLWVLPPVLQSSCFIPPLCFPQGGWNRVLGVGGAGTCAFTGSLSHTDLRQV